MKLSDFLPNTTIWHIPDLISANLALAEIIEEQRNKILKEVGIPLKYFETGLPENFINETF